LATSDDSKVRDFQDLHVWHDAMDLCERIYRLTWSFPRQETYGLAAQLQRASVSIPSNIAEGRMRGTLRDYIHFVAMARGSLAEVRTQLILAQRREMAPADTVAEIGRMTEVLAMGLNALRKSLQARLDSESSNPKSQNPKPKTNGAQVLN
jgi:four helix bundle protein